MRLVKALCTGAWPLLFAIPDGGRRDAVTGAHLKAEGVRAGVPDMFLAGPRQNAPGLFPELKKQKGGRVSENRKTMHEALSQAGYPVCICRGWDEAKRAIEDCIGGTRDRALRFVQEEHEREDRDGWSERCSRTEDAQVMADAGAFHRFH